MSNNKVIGSRGRMVPLIWGLFVALILSAVSPLAQTAGSSARSSIPPKLLVYPQMILHNGKILTVDESFGIVQAVAIRDERFLEVGTNQEVLQLQGPQTRVIDLKGQTVVPGFFDTHLHQAWRGNISKRGVKNVRFETLDKGLEEVRAELLKHPAGEWVIFNGIRNDVMVNHLTRWDLDKASPDHPIRIILDSALSVVNTRGWEKLRDKIGAIPGVIRDLETGEPNGHIRGFTNGVLQYEEMEWPEDWETRMVEEQKEVFRRLNSQGLTTVIGRAQGLSVTILQKLWRQKELTLRTRVCMEVVRYNPYTEAYLKRIGNLSGFGDEWFKIIGTTIGPADGTGGTGGMLTRETKKREIEMPGGPAWKDRKGENKWALAVQGDYRKGTEYENVLIANRYGWNVACVHTQGDMAAKMMLDAYEDADKERSINGRHFGFDHGALRTEEDFRRALRLGVNMSFAPKYLFRKSPSALIWQFGEQIHGFTALGTGIGLGFKPVMESDITGYYSASLWNIEAVVTRTDENGRVWGAKEAISRQDALRMRTAWAAHYSGDEDQLGTIEEGKIGDLVVLGGDYLTVPADQISEIPIVLTILGGKIVYDRDRDGEITSRLWDR